MYDPEQDGNSKDSRTSCTLCPSCAKITQVHCLPEPQTAGLFELLMNPEVSLAWRKTGSSVENKTKQTEPG